MQIYPLYPSCTEDTQVTLCIEPGSVCRIAFFRQEVNEELSSLLTPNVSAYDRTSSYVSKAGLIIRAENARVKNTFNQDWRWPSLTYDLSSMAWKTGVYFAVIYPVQLDGNPINQLGTHLESNAPIYPVPPDSHSIAMFVITPQSSCSSPIAYTVPIATYHAYNFAGGGSLYPCKKNNWAKNDTVTYRRPGGGTGDSTIAQCMPSDYYDQRSLRQTFSHWDAKFIRWLLAEGFTVDFYSDLDLDRLRVLTYPKYKLLLSIGHHEYWSKNMRASVQQFIAEGGNYAVFGGNTCYKPITFNHQTGTIEKPLTDFDTWPNNDEEQLIGVTYGGGGGWWGRWNSSTQLWTSIERTAVGYTVKEPKHWAFHGTNLHYGSEFGKDESLVGYECDGIRNSTLNGFRKVLAEARLGEGWNEGSQNNATMVIFGKEDAGSEKKSLVFNAATTDWARVLQETNSPSSSIIRQITYNVIKTLS